MLGRHGTLAVERLAERVDDAAEERGTHRHLEHAAGPADLLALLDLDVVAQDHGADHVLFEVERETVQLVAEIEHLAGHGAGEAVDAGDPVADLEHRAHLVDVELGLVALELLLQNGGDLFGADLHRRILFSLV